jgi:penicillin-binding protein activator
MHNRCRLLFLIPLLAILAVSCETMGSSVQRVSADTQVDLSGHWNDSDAQLVAEAMIDDVLRRPWLSDFQTANGRKPVVIVGEVRNRSSEHIDSTIFIKDIERELINSGKVSFVASADERDAVRAERMDQQTEANPDTIKRLGQETGADFYLRGVISSVTDAVGGKKAVAFQVDLELIQIETNEKVWIGNKVIKKVINRAQYVP